MLLLCGSGVCVMRPDVEAVPVQRVRGLYSAEEASTMRQRPLQCGNASVVR